MIEAVVFDMDGVLIDSEQVWDGVRESYAREKGGTWHANAHTDMMGMSSTEWSRYMHEVIQVPEPATRISDEVAARVADAYARHLPLLNGAVEAVKRVAARWPLAVASSSNRTLVDLVLRLTGLTACFTATVSSEEVARGKPHPDVYLEAARRLGVKGTRCAAIEDSENGMLSAKAAGMEVIAIPNRRYPPNRDTLGIASLVLDSLTDLTPTTIEAL